MQHIRSTENSVTIKRGSSDEDVIKALETDEKIEDMKVKITLEV